MERDTTRSLSRVLEEIRDCKEADRFIDEHAARDSFTAYINEKLADKGRTPAEVRDASGISKNYFYNILNGDRKNPSRDRIIAIAVGLGLDYGETQRALELAGKAPLRQGRKLALWPTKSVPFGEVTVNMAEKSALQT